MYNIYYLALKFLFLFYLHQYSNFRLIAKQLDSLTVHYVFSMFYSYENCILFSINNLIRIIKLQYPAAQKNYFNIFIRAM
jgi:hypothetical protein